jgi:hypothetical protein
VKGHRPNRIPLHLILSIITLGVLLIVWTLVGLFGGEMRRTISVQPDGRVVDEHGRGHGEVREREGGRDSVRGLDRATLRELREEANRLASSTNER